MFRWLHITVSAACMGLLVLVCLRFIVFNACVNRQKTTFRFEALSKTEEKNVITLNLPAGRLYVDGKGLEWKDNNREVVIGGKYYEVISVHRQGSMAQLFLVEDEKENNLFGKFFESEGSEKMNYYVLASLLGDVNFIPINNIVLPHRIIQEKLAPACEETDFPEGFVTTAEIPPRRC